MGADVEGFRGGDLVAVDGGFALEERLYGDRCLMEYFAMITLGVFLGLPEGKAGAVVGAVLEEQDFVDESALLFQQG